MLLPLQLPAFAVQEAEGAEGAPRGFGRLEERLHRHQGELLQSMQQHPVYKKQHWKLHAKLNKTQEHVLALAYMEVT